MSMRTTMAVPVHGSYINDVKGALVLMTFQNRRWGEEAPDADWAIILALINRTYPEVNMADLRAYPNKGFTFVAEKPLTGDLVAVYRHDWSWQVVLVPAKQYAAFAAGRNGVSLATTEFPLI